MFEYLTYRVLDSSVVFVGRNHTHPRGVGWGDSVDMFVELEQL